MYEALDPPFRQLARVLHSVLIWTDQMLAIKELSEKDRKLVLKLQKYVKQSQKDPANWSKHAVATRTMEKVENLWSSLLVGIIIPSDRRIR